MADVLLRRRPDARRPVLASNGHDALVAAASIVRPHRNLRLSKYPWQTDLWNYYREGIGTFKYAMLWHSQTMSRVRLIAALSKPGAPAPEPVDDGPAVDALAEFYGGVSGQSQYMAEMDLQLQIPGEGYVVGYFNSDTDEYEWCVKSSAELDVTSGRKKQGGTGPLWKMQVDEGLFKTLPEDSYVFRQWQPDPEFGWRPDSPARGALKTLRLIDMFNRRIMSMAVSRLAMNGFLKYASEITFDTAPQFKEEHDPFVAELLDIAGKVMENPGSALAAMPLPLKIPAEYFDKFEHVEFANPFDERMMEILKFLYDVLATEMNMPKEVVTGMGETSHWNAWSLDEQGIETHIKPPAEMMVQGLTTSWLKPWLRSKSAPLKKGDGEYIVWYSTHELDVPPDLSSAADAAFDRQQINGESYLALKNMDSSMKPTKIELREQLLLQLAKDPTQAPAAIEELTGSPVAGASTGPGGDDGGAPQSQPTPATGPPNMPPANAPPAPPTAPSRAPVKPTPSG